MQHKPIPPSPAVPSEGEPVSIGTIIALILILFGIIIIISILLSFITKRL